jgi:hypothetical protein
MKNRGRELVFRSGPPFGAVNTSSSFWIKARGRLLAASGRRRPPRRAAPPTVEPFPLIRRSTPRNPPLRDHPGMTDATDATKYPVVMEVADWLVINGTMGNEVDGLSQEGFDIPEGQDDWGEDGRDPRWAELTKLGVSIRQAGWDQLPDWPDTYEGMQTWPAPGRTEAMKLTARQWGLVVHALESWAEVSDRGNEPEGAADQRRIANMVREQLAAQGLDPVPVITMPAD